MINKLKLKSEFSRNVLTLMTGTTIAVFYTSVKNIERWLKQLKDEDRIYRFTENGWVLCQVGVN